MIRDQRGGSRSRVGRAGRGFSLLEMIIVLVLMALLAALVVPRLTGVLGKNKARATRVQIELLAGAVERFNLDVGRYPTAEEGLAALVERPPTVEEDAWDGPYTEKNFVPKDGWGHDFLYRYDEDGRYLIVSLGADGRPGGDGENADLDNRNT
ncbi:MAG: type II secretion system protein GspG [Planctomycetota bacterium]|nr:MAG: type II secretion system protein GspG [Planctomycetota bacterium]